MYKWIYAFNVGIWVFNAGLYASFGYPGFALLFFALALFYAWGAYFEFSKNW